MTALAAWVSLAENAGIGWTGDAGPPGTGVPGDNVDGAARVIFSCRMANAALVTTELAAKVDLTIGDACACGETAVRDGETRGRAVAAASTLVGLPAENVNGTTAEGEDLP